MALKIIITIINIENDMCDPLYVPNKGHVVDKNSGNILYKLPKIEMSKFFYFAVEFNSYRYTDFFQPKTGGYRKQLSSRIYNLVLYLNVLEIIKDNGSTKSLKEKLTYYLTISNIMELRIKKNYYTDKNTISQFIDERNSHKMYMIPWYHVKINNMIIFNLKLRMISRNLKKIYFRRNGGIIETNNVTRLIKNHFKLTIENKMKSLIILPIHMTNLWSGANILIYDKLHTLKKSDIDYFRSENFGQIIIHECHINFLPKIKTLITLLNCNKIWIINSLPLKYYFANHSISAKLKITDIVTITNLWLDFNINEKKMYKTEIIRSIFTEFNKYYTIIDYSDKISEINTIKLNLTPHEKFIYGEFNQCYQNWKNKLTNDEENIYSFTTRRKNNILEAKLFDNFIYLAASVMPLNNVFQYFKFNIRDTIKHIKKKTINMKIFIGLHKKLDSIFQGNGSTNFQQSFQNIEDIEQKVSNTMENYYRYLNGHVYHDLEDLSCPVCYCSENLVKTKLICGHSVCIECILSSLQKSTKCPLCNEFITIPKMVIIEESLVGVNQGPMYSSDIINFLKKIKSSNIILTNLLAFKKISVNSEYKINVLNIAQNNIHRKIKKISQIDHIILFLTPNYTFDFDSNRGINQIVNYFRLFNQKPKISRIEIQELDKI